MIAAMNAGFSIGFMRRAYSLSIWGLSPRKNFLGEEVKADKGNLENS